MAGVAACRVWVPDWAPPCPGPRVPLLVLLLLLLLLLPSKANLQHCIDG
jgi:hypothetical protein